MVNVFAVHVMLFNCACNGVRGTNLLVVVISQTDVSVSPLRTPALSNDNLFPLQSSAQREIEDSMQVFQELIRSIQRTQAELVLAIEEKQRETERCVEEVLQYPSCSVSCIRFYLTKRFLELTLWCLTSVLMRTRWSQGLIGELEQEITELQRRNTDLEHLSRTEDHIHFLQVGGIADFINNTQQNMHTLQSRNIAHKFGSILSLFSLSQIFITK